MEPGTSREAPTAGVTRESVFREETPGEEAGCGALRTGMLSRRGAEGDIEEEVKASREEEEDAGRQNRPVEEEEEAGNHEEELDPRIQEELEHLNQASDEINKLELQLDDARSSYRRILSDSARKLNSLGCQLGACIEKARPYYEARRHAKEAQQETQKAALRFERAASMHAASREMVYVAEQGLLADRNAMDATWQEMLNHATAKVNEAERERLLSECEHQRVTQLCQQAEVRVLTLQQSLKKNIVRSKPYFELKARFNHILEEHKVKVVQLEQQVSQVKTRYSVALRNLEQISEQIHAQRGRIRASRGRSSPVGAEAEVRAPGTIQVTVCVGGVGAMESDWADGEKTRLWVERHRESGWGQKERQEAEHRGADHQGAERWGAEPVASDRMSIISLQTVASDLQKCDSVEHLGELSDDGSMQMDRWEELVRVGLQQEDTSPYQEEQEGGRKDKLESFVKQHHRSVSL